MQNANRQSRVHTATMMRKPFPLPEDEGETRKMAGRSTALNDRKVFTYEEAAALLPEAQRITAEAFAEVESLPESESAIIESERIITDWAGAIIELGIEVKGLWLIDFDNGSGYYCWKHPEPSLQYFHGYEEGIAGRMRLQ
jgi:hypothetical protein